MTDPARKTKKDPGNPDICNVYTLHKHFSPPATVEEVGVKCRGALFGCLDCKRILADNMAQELAPIRARAEALRAEPGKLDAVLAAGAAKARAEARKTMALVRAQMGFLPAQEG
jgi:tryptophanyl-tRNA synthetase